MKLQASLLAFIISILTSGSIAFATTSFEIDGALIIKSYGDDVPKSIEILSKGIVYNITNSEDIDNSCIQGSYEIVADNPVGINSYTLLDIIECENPMRRICTAIFAMMINDEGRCMPASNGCILHDLKEEGFRVAETGECRGSNFPIYPILPKKNRICTAEFAMMINDAGHCMSASDGCIIRELQSAGYRRDTSLECSL